MTSLADTTTDLKHSTHMDLSSPLTSPADTTTDLSSVKSSHTDQAYSSLRSSVSSSAEWTSVDSFTLKRTTDTSTKVSTDTWVKVSTDISTQVSTDTASASECVCPCEYVSVVNKTKEELIAIATKDLYIDKTQTSTYKNSKKSAEDHRSSSRNIGIVGVLVISITMSLLVLVDCINGPLKKILVCVTKHKKHNAPLTL
ncbi:unnamed protein product [Mytilus edulis]|uniref:Uncharacterized protein n=1 Tax=Mytilus edulis TaxID=6550 RepID=A0A8S3PUX8_MYTED|nr:unnamed protein product [Mytilus edulis]